MRATPVDLVPRLAGDPEAASAFEWGGVAWGMYALAEGILAEALRDLDGSSRDEAIAIAESVVDGTPDSKWLVEHERARADARAFLKIWRGSPRRG